MKRKRVNNVILFKSYATYKILGRITFVAN